MSLARKHESRPKAFEALLDFFDTKVRSGFFLLLSDVEKIWKKSHDTYFPKKGGFILPGRQSS